MPIRALPNGRPIPPHSLVAIDRNRWSSSTETGGRHRPKPVVVFNRNDWSSSTETAGRHQPVCAIQLSWRRLSGLGANPGHRLGDNPCWPRQIDPASGGGPRRSVSSPA